MNVDIYNTHFSKDALDPYFLETILSYKLHKQLGSAIKISEEPKRREWPFFTLMDVYFSDQVNDPSLRLFSSTKTLKESLDESVFEDDPIIASAIAAATSGACMEIDELLKRQKERRANEAKYTAEKNFRSKATDYSINGNKHNVITVKNTTFVHSPKDNLNSSKLPTDHHEVTNNEKNVQLGPMFQQPQSPPPATVHNKYPDPNTIDQYLLSWNNFLGNMSRGFHTLQKDEKMVDVTIAAGGKIFKAHKLVLSVCSPYFQEIFLENPSNHPILLMADVEANHMAGLLNFMYSGQVNVKYEDLPIFLKVAEAMKIKGLHTEKPEEQNLKEIQFSRENNLTDFQISSSIPISIDIAAQSVPTSTLKDEEGACQTSYHLTDHEKNTEILRKSINTVNLEQRKNKFSIFKASASKKILDHSKQQKYLAKRKLYVHFENDLKEKRTSNLVENELYNNRSHSKMICTQQIPQNNTEEVLNLAQNEVSNAQINFEPTNATESKNMTQYGNTNFADTRKDIHPSINVTENETNSYMQCEDGNNNICIQQNNTTQKNNFSRDEIGFYEDDCTKSTDIRSCCDNNDSNNIHDTDNNSKHCYTNKNVKTKTNDDINVDCNLGSKIFVSKHADNNNNLFLTSTTNAEPKDIDSNPTTKETKTKFTIKANSSFY